MLAGRRGLSTVEAEKERLLLGQIRREELEAEFCDSLRTELLDRVIARETQEAEFQDLLRRVAFERVLARGAAP